MATIAIFHSALGVREGVRDAARRLSAAGHEPHVVDYYGDNRSFDDQASAADYVDEVGFPALMQAAIDGVADLPDGFAVLGFSNGSGMAEYVTTRRSVSKAVLGLRDASPGDHRRRRLARPDGCPDPLRRR